MRRIAFVMAAAAWALACASSGGGGSDAIEPVEAPTCPTSSVQDELTETAFWQSAADDAELAALKDALAGQGFASFVTAGALAEDGGARLDFAAYADTGGAERAVVRHCASSDCVRAIARVEDGAVRWADAVGSDVAVRPVAIPPFLRELSVAGDSTSVVSPLSQPAVVDPSSIDLSRRRVMLVSQFGSAFGLPGASVIEALAGGGQFTEAAVLDHAPYAALRDAIVTAYPHEVLVVVAQPVRQLFKQAVSKDEPDWHKTIGIEAASGVYGFSTVGADLIATALRAAPLGGPGVVLLLGSESLGDGTDGMVKAPTSMMKQLDFPGTVVAGFVGGAHPAVLLDVSKTFLSELQAGRTAGEARDLANAWLDAYGSTARLSFTDGSDAGYRLLPPSDAFWSGAAPKTADFSPFFHFRLYCASAPGKAEKAIEEKQANPLFRDLAVEGPVFRGGMDLEISPEKTLHADVLGVLGDLRAGAHFYFAFQGDAKEGYEGLTLYANADITKVSKAAGTTTVEFRGSAQALAFTDAKGQACTLHDTDLEPMVEGQGTSKMILKE
jgi:hypothetical protein